MLENIFVLSYYMLSTTTLLIIIGLLVMAAVIWYATSGGSSPAMPMTRERYVPVLTDADHRFIRDAKVRVKRFEPSIYNAIGLDKRKQPWAGPLHKF